MTSRLRMVPCAMYGKKILFLLLLCCLTCAPGRAGGEARVAQTPDPRMQVWEELVIRLKDDGLYNDAIGGGLVALPPPSPVPMGRKIKELYISRFVRPQPPPPGTPKPKPVYLYPKVVTAENTAACRAFIAANKAAFARMKQRWGVPEDVAVALIFVETRLGAALGKDNVFYTLASMAATRRPEQLGVWLDVIDDPQGKREWLEETLNRRSDWAYGELSAFIRYAEQNGLDPFSVPGSIYGAFGICQFMPTSVAPYAADGNDDGLIDLFVLDDALASLASYLTKHGWKADLPRSGRHAVLRRYNRLDIYANTILALADTVRGEPVGKPIVTAGKKSVAQPKKNAPDKKNAKRVRANSP